MVQVIAPQRGFIQNSSELSDYILIIEGYRRKFRSQASDNMDRWKAEQGRGREKRKIRRKKSRRERARRKKMQMREKVGKSRNIVFFQWFGAPLKRRVRSQLARWEMKTCTPLWREAPLQVKMYKTHQVRTTFGCWDVEKVHAVMARSTFRSQNVQNTPRSDHFWKFRCGKSVRRCGAKHISKWKCSKHQGFGPLLEVQMSKKCAPLWREAHFEVKMLKTPGARTTFGGSDVASLHRNTTTITTQLHSTTLHYTPLHSTTLHTKLHYITLHYTALPSTTPHYITLHSTTQQLQLQIQNYTPLHSTTLHYITLHSTTLHYTTLHYTTLHYTTFHYTSLHYTTLHATTLQLHLRLHNYTPLHEITLHYTKLHYTTLHSTTHHYTILHYTTLHYTEWHCTTDRQVDR